MAKLTSSLVAPERELFSGELDLLPDGAFYMAGAIEQAVEKAETLVAGA